MTDGSTFTRRFERLIWRFYLIVWLVGAMLLCMGAYQIGHSIGFRAAVEQERGQK